MPPKNSKNYITPEGFKKLTDELQELLRVERPKICDLVAWAVSLGDRSENADYIYGKKRLREIDRRIRFLNSRINIAEVVNNSGKQLDQIQFGATVTVEDEEGLSKRYTIVGVDEIDLSKGMISWKSPVGRALLGKQLGDSALVKGPEKEIELEISKIAY